MTRQKCKSATAKTFLKSANYCAYERIRRLCFFSLFSFQIWNECFYDERTNTNANDQRKWLKIPFIPRISRRRSSLSRCEWTHLMRSRKNGSIVTSARIKTVHRIHWSPLDTFKFWVMPEHEGVTKPLYFNIDQMVGNLRRSVLDS